MTTPSDESDDANESTYTDMQIHDDQLPEDLRPENDLTPGSTPGPSEEAAAPEGAEGQLG